MPEENEVKPWSGEGLPTVGTDCIATPHNTQWGFEHVEDYRCLVLGYHHEAVWLMELHSDGSPSLSFISSRIDKVDFSPYRVPEQIAAEEREKAIDLMLEDAQRPGNHMMSRFHAEDLYDAGYRKEVRP